MNAWQTVTARLDYAARTYPRAYRASLVATTFLAVFALIASAWYARVIATSIPGREELRQIGAMAQATTLLDVNDHHAFTIYEEQRIDVPLERVSPHLIKAIIAVEDQRFY